MDKLTSSLSKTAKIRVSSCIPIASKDWSFLVSHSGLLPFPPVTGVPGREPRLIIPSSSSRRSLARQGRR